MTNHSIMALVVVAGTAVLPIRLAHAFDSLPLSDGSYAQSSEDCDALKKGELDFIDFVVAKNGRAYDMPEVGCLVATVKQLRPNRFLVESDCVEAGEAYQQTVVIDQLESGRIRIDGEELMLCEEKGSRVLLQTPEEIIASLPARRIPLPEIAPVPDVVSGRPDDLIEQWLDAEEGCRGGFGNDPATWKACDVRTGIIAQLHKVGWCFGVEGQSRSEYDWHPCGPDSIR